MTGTDAPQITFWYEFASTYSYLAAERIEALAEAANVQVRWRPFMLGPIFAAQGLNSSPFNIYPAKGKHMWRDMDRWAAKLGLPRVVRPEPFPQNALLAARVATGLPDEARPAFSRAVYRAEFADGRAISDKSTIEAILRAMGRDPAADLAVAASEPVKERLKAVTEEARHAGVFGAPTFICEDGEMFWGNDRLEDALAWAHHRGL